MTEDGPANLGQLTHVSSDPQPWRVEVRAHEVGKTSIEEVSAAIDAKPAATALVVSGVDQPTFEMLIRRHGSQFSAIKLWKCPRIADLTPLEDLPKLRYLAIYWNQRSARFWDCSRNPELRGLQLEDFTRVHDLDDLRRATSLEELRFGDAIWSSWILASLGPLESLGRLKWLSFDAKKIEDGRIQPLAALRQLTSLAYPAHQFTTRQVAWLRAHLPETLASRSLDPLWDFRDKPIVGSERVRDVLVVGKRKPWLDSRRDAARIERYVAEFESMVATFREHPEAEPD